MTAVPHPDTCQTCGYSIRYPQWPGDRCACANPSPPVPAKIDAAKMVADDYARRAARRTA